MKDTTELNITSNYIAHLKMYTSLSVFFFFPRFDVLCFLRRFSAHHNSKVPVVLLFFFFPQNIMCELLLAAAVENPRRSAVPETSLCGTNNHAIVKVTEITFSPHSAG